MKAAIEIKEKAGSDKYNVKLIISSAWDGQVHQGSDAGKAPLLRGRLLREHEEPLRLPRAADPTAMVHQKTLKGPKAEERQAMLQRSIIMWGA